MLCIMKTLNQGFDVLEWSNEALRHYAQIWCHQKRVKLCLKVQQLGEIAEALQHCPRELQSVLGVDQTEIVLLKQGEFSQRKRPFTDTTMDQLGLASKVCKGTKGKELI